MQYQITSSFEKTISAMDDKRKQRVKDAVKKTVVFFETGCKPKGLGIKKLRSNYWKINYPAVSCRVSLRASLFCGMTPRSKTAGYSDRKIRASIKDRIIFKLSDDLVQWIIVGNHEEIKKYLKQVK